MFMSDLADAVFGGQLIGHVIAGDELTGSVITEAAMKASLSSSLVVGEPDLSPVEQQILEAKVAQATASEGEYIPSDIAQDFLEAQLDSSIAETFLS